MQVGLDKVGARQRALRPAPEPAATIKVDVAPDAIGAVTTRIVLSKSLP